MKPIMIKPPKLQRGDKVATVSLSWGGPGTIPQRYQTGKQQLQDELELQVVEMPHTLADPEWISRNPEARAEDLMLAFSNPEIKGVISTIGGDDSIRILPFLDLEVVRNNPKVFLGYSDTTITHLACFQAGLVSFYGPAIMSGFAENGGLFPYLVDSVYQTLFSSKTIGIISPNIDGWTVERLEWADPDNQTIKRKLNPSTGWRYLQGKGIQRGHLIGGCFEVLDWLRGTHFWPTPDQWEKAILFLETSEGAPSPEMVKFGLSTFASSGVLEKLSGILFGRPGGQVPPEKFFEYDQVLLKVVRDEAGLDELPIITNMDFGHTDPMMTLPYGVQAEIDCDQQQFRIIENAVVD